MGGTKYGNELKKMDKYLKIFLELSKVRKVVRIDNEEVDYYQSKLEKQIKNSDLNDAHLIAMVIVSKCKLICSKDSTSYRFIKNPGFYPDGVDVPKIYSNYSNKNLLNDFIIVEICEPKEKINKIQKERLSKLIAN